MKPEVGQRVLLKPVGDNRRSTTKVREYVVSKVGRKYLEVWDGDYVHSAIKFHLEDFTEVTQYSAGWKLYFSEQAMLDEEEYENLQNTLRKTFDHWSRQSLTLDQLRRIDAITKEVPNGIQ